MMFARPQPDVDSLAPARSALRAFGFAEFLSPIPNRLKSPPGRRNSNRIFFDFADDGPANPVARIIKGTANDSPSPWGEGRVEGGREPFEIRNPNSAGATVGLAAPAGGTEGNSIP